MENYIERYEAEKQRIERRCPECGRNNARVVGRQLFPSSRCTPEEYECLCDYCGYSCPEDDWRDGYETFEEWMDRNDIEI